MKIFSLFAVSLAAGAIFILSGCAGETGQTTTTTQTTTTRTSLHEADTVGASAMPRGGGNRGGY